MTRDEALALVREFVKNEGLVRHMLSVEAAMRFYAEKFGEDVERWGLIGLLHDFDWEIHPTLEQHPQDGAPILRARGVPEEIIQDILSHADHLNMPRDTLRRRAISACDEITGLITAVALVRPSRSLYDLEANSVKKKWKDKAFAAGTSRAEMEHAELTTFAWLTLVALVLTTALVAGLEAMGLSLLAAPEHRMWTVTAVRVPAGVEEAKGAVLIVGGGSGGGRRMNLIVLTRPLDEDSELERVRAHDLGHAVADRVGVAGPVAVLVPHEVDALFDNLRGLRDSGHTMLFISHKLDEVLAIADDITVMRRGETVGEVDPATATRKQLAELMVGSELPTPETEESTVSEAVTLTVSNLWLTDDAGRHRLSDISFDIHRGEFIAIMGPISCVACGATVGGCTPSAPMSSRYNRS